MTVRSWIGRARVARCATLAAIIIAISLPLAAAHAQRHGPAQMQRGGASAQPQQPSRGAPSQDSVRGEFRTALGSYGHWRHHARWGDVWIPGSRPRDWRPYTAGHWVYTNDWGWYWISDDSESRWGWVTYHYGRWAFDDGLGWCWVAGNEWAPAWVQWRRGEGDFAYVGWAPLPPDDVIVQYSSEPRFWVFVRARDFIAPRLTSVILPIRQYDTFIRQTVVVNRTTMLADRGRFAVNPGIEPNIIAKFRGQPFRTYDVRPAVLAGTTHIPGAREVRPQDARGGNFRAATVQQTQNTIRAAERVPAPRPLAAGERGRLGDHPPRAAQGSSPTTGQAPNARDQQRQQQQQGQAQQGRSRQEPAQTQGRGGAEQRQPPATGRSAAEQREQQLRQQQGRQPTQRQEGRSKQEPAQTQGRAGAEQRQQRAQPRAPQPERSRAVERERQTPSAERQAAPRQDRATTGRGGGPQQAAPQQPRSRPSVTEGRGGPQHAAPQPRPSTTEGRGGGAPRAAPQGRGPGGGATDGRGGRH